MERENNNITSFTWNVVSIYILFDFGKLVVKNEENAHTKFVNSVCQALSTIRLWYNLHLRWSILNRPHSRGKNTPSNIKMFSCAKTEPKHPTSIYPQSEH